MKRIFAAALLCLPRSAMPASAEVDEIKIGKQYGLPYIQFVIMEDQKLIEKHAKLQGLGDIKVNWATLGGPAQLNDGIISGAIDIAAVGLPNLITMWEKTRTNVKVRAIAGLNFMPLLLLTRDPKIKTLRDYGEKDRIAVPSVKISMQAILLEMAAAKEFGDARLREARPAHRLDGASGRVHGAQFGRRRGREPFLLGAVPVPPAQACPATTRWSRPTTSSGRIR